MRTYIVLLTTKNGDLHPVELTQANGAHQAIKRARAAFAIEVDVERAESWHAIPVRNWTELAVNTEIPEPTTTFAEANQLVTALPTREADPSEPDEDEQPDLPDDDNPPVSLTGASDTSGNAA